MIIDVHRHFWRAQERYRSPLSDLPGREETPMVKPDWEKTARELVEEMDGAGVDRSVLIVADYADRFGTPLLSIDEENWILAQTKRRYPERIVAFYGIDPRRPSAADRYERAIKDWGAAGLKLHPTIGYFPYDRVCYAMYEVSVAYGLPVLFHSGPRFQPLLYSRFTHPLEFDQVATDFPKLTMILGHAGGDWWADCITIARAHPNILVDLAEWQTRIRDSPDEALPALHRMHSLLGAERILWGTDFPQMRRYVSLKESVEIFRELPALGARYGFRFSEDDVEALLGSNTARILK